MLIRVRIEKPAGVNGIRTDEVRTIFSNHNLWGKAKHVAKMKTLMASQEFVCTFPNPKAPWQPYQWLVGFQCVEEKISDAASRAM